MALTLDASRNSCSCFRAPTAAETLADATLFCECPDRRPLKMSAVQPASQKRVMALLIPALICNMIFLYDISVKGLQSFQSLIGVPHNERYDKVFFGGLLGSLFSALQFISSPTLGSLSDVYGRRAIIILCCIVTAFSYLVWLRANTFTLFVLSRVLGGLSKGNINVAVSIVSDVYTTEDHPKGMALIGISYSVGFLVGPMIGAYLSSIAPTLIYRKLWRFLKKKNFEEIKKTRQELIRPNALFRFSAVQAPVQKKEEMQKIGLVYFLYLFLYSGLEFTLPFLTHLRFDFGSMQQGKIYLFTGLLMLPIQGRLVRKVPIHRQKALAEKGMLCIIPAYVLVSISNSLTVFYFGMVFYAIASAIVVSCLTTLVHSVYPAQEKGVIAGVFRSLGCLARALGPMVASTCFWMIGPTNCYLLGAVLLVIPFEMFRRMKNPAELKSD
ncbi:unnamed protein product [Caenorhabditis auriculariae]|uniref:Major facilitator superfamily (MFS) profile domain-containing protein n=1 Tax=Caenorhabditis auriculariae TaxID=2777116 RepID=A0A8S1GPA2_9PELO|nr:unnamed protein product [Caenorhabditis auriculariae]